MVLNGHNESLGKDGCCQVYQQDDVTQHPGLSSAAWEEANWTLAGSPECRKKLLSGLKGRL